MAIDNELSRFDFLTPATGPVVSGLEDHEKIYALEQMDKYMPLRTLPGEKGNSAIYRVELTEEQRSMVAAGADILVEILHFGGNLAPSRVMLMNERDLSEQEMRDFASWFRAQTKGPYKVTK